MIRLEASLKAWGSAEFAAVLAGELAALGADGLLLQQGLTRGSHALDDGIAVMLLYCAEDDETLRLKVAVHYQGVIAGCSCADDPTPLDTTVEYVELEVGIDKDTANARIAVAADSF